MDSIVESVRSISIGDRMSSAAEAIWPDARLRHSHTVKGTEESVQMA